MKSLAHHHLHWQRRHGGTPISNFWLFELSTLLHMVGYSVVSIFIPILLLQNGYPLRDILWFYVLFNGLDVPLNFFADWLTRRIGARLVVAVGTVACITMLSLLLVAAHSWAILILFAIFAAFYDTLYWVAHLYLFIKAEAHGEVAIEEDRAILTSVGIIGTLLGPMIGGMLLIFGTHASVLSASITFLFFSLLPLFYMHRIADKPTTAFLPPRKFFALHEERRNWLYFFLYCFHDPVEYILWPIFIYLTFGSVTSVAVLAVLAGWSSAVFSYFVGKQSQRHYTVMVLVGSLCIALVWLARIYIHNADFYYPSIIVMTFLALITTVPIEGSIAHRAREREALSAMTYRNTSTMLPRFILFLILALMVNVFQVGFDIAIFGVVLLSVASTVVLRKELTIKG